MRTLALLGLGTAALPAMALAQTDITAVAPTTSSSYVRVGDLRSLVGNLLDPDATTSQGFTFTPSIGVEELATDNVLQRSHPQLADLATFVTPQLLVTGQTRLVQANIVYAPSLQVYAATSQQDQIVQNFNGQSLITMVPDLLFLNLRGYGAEQSSTANAGQSNSPILSNQNRVQTLGFSASPYVTHRFGGDGTVQAGLVYTYSQQTGSSAYGANTLPSIINSSPLTSNAFGQTFGNSTSRSTEEYANYTTGENLGRFNDSLKFDASQLTGSGTVSNARRITAIDSVGYAINRSITLLGNFGYEDLTYAGIPPVRVRDAVYIGGVRLTPNQDSSLTVTYGHKDGFNSAALSASYQLTARLRVFGSYSEGLSTSQQELQDNLNNTTVDQFGNSLDSVTGAPVLLNDQLLGLQSGLYRLKRGSVTAVLIYDRDTFSLNILNENRTILSVTPGQTGYSDQGTLANASWTHQLNPALTGTVSVQYGTSTTQTTPTTTTQNTNLSLSTGYAFSETLTGNAQYYVSNISSTSPQQSYVQNVFLVGLRKSF